MMDTDSFIVEIQAEDVDKFECSLHNVFDRSKYPLNHPMYSNINADKLGLLKNEKPNGIEEAICIAPKIYVLECCKNGGGTETTSRAKGIQRCQKDQLRFWDYEIQLYNPHPTTIDNRRFDSYRHDISTKLIKKVGLKSFDTKRYLLEDNINTLAFGHKDIPVTEPLVEAADQVNQDQILSWEQKRIGLHSWNNGLEIVRRVTGRVLAVKPQEVCIHPPINVN